jgi:uncharacterized repeat protein (TIGR03809 family)
MTSHFDADRYQQALERWRVLADRRLEHMTVLYETGRWRRYFTEEQFLRVIRETRAAADMWHRIVPVAEHQALFALAAEQTLDRTMPPSPFATSFSEFEQVA